MRHFQKLASGVDVTPVMLELNRAPDLWDAHTARKTAPGTPHAAMSDIWVRWRPLAEITGPQSYAEPHFPVWYPAFYRVPSLRPIIRSVAARVGADHIGGVLISRIPPGGVIEPHADSGWHAEYHNCKVYVPIRANDACVNTCEDEAVVMVAGDVWTFDNLVTHSVENRGTTDRITLIISMRCD